MSVAQFRCRDCDKTFRLRNDVSSTGGLRCPKCGKKLRPVEVEPVEEAEPVREKVTAKPARGGARPDPDVTPRKRKKTTQPTSNPLLLWGAVGGGVGLIVLLAIVVIVYSILGSGGSSSSLAQNGGPIPPPPGFRPPPNQPPGPDNGIPNPPPDQNPFPGQPKNPDGEEPLPDVPPLPPLPPAKDRPHLVLDPGGHSAIAKCVVFTPDGKYVLSVSVDKTARLTEVETGETVGVLHLPIGIGPEGQLNAAAVSPDGKRFAVAGTPYGLGKHGAMIYVLSMRTGQIETVLRGHRGEVICLAFSPDGKFIASGSSDTTALVYALDKKGAVVARCEGHSEYIRRVAFHPSGTLLATASQDATARIWDLSGPAPGGATPGRKPIVLTGHKNQVNALVWSRDGKFLVTAGFDGILRTWDPSGRLLKAYGPVMDGDAHLQITGIDITPDGKEVLYGGIMATGRAGVWNLETNKNRIDFTQHTNTIQDAALSPDGKLAATTGGARNETLVWRVADGTVVQRLQSAGAAVWGIGWTDGGKALAFGSEARALVATGQTPVTNTFRLDDFEPGPKPDDKVLRDVHATRDGWSLERIDFFKIAIKRNGQEVGVYQSPSRGDRIYSFTLLPGNRAVMGGSFTHNLIDLTTLKIVQEFKGHTGLVLSVAPSPDGALFATGSSDQTIRIWKPDREEPVLTLFLAGREWIAWTPEGFYAASAYGERLMGWQLNNGPEELANYYPAVQFRDSLYQPEVIRFLLPAKGDLRTALAMAIREKRKQIAGTNVGQVLPPEAAIVSPTPGAETVENKLEVKATAKSRGRHPVKAMKLLVDGRPYLGARGTHIIDDPRAGEVQTSWTVILPPGKHTLAVQAESAVSKGVSQTVEVTRTSGEKSELPNLYVLSVGVSSYPGKLRLAYAASDATLITETFKKKGGSLYGKVETRIITDKDATRANVMAGLEWLATVMTPLDVCVFSFSGHGARDPAGNFYLVPVDVSNRNVAATCISGEAVKTALGNIPGKVVAILDACHSGTIAEDMQAGKADNLVRDLVTDDYGIVVMCSSLGREYSMESPETKAGFFTLSLTEGISGRADFNKDKVVHIHELDLYASLRVRQLSGGEQNPTTGRPPGIRSFPLTKP